MSYGEYRTVFQDQDARLAEALSQLDAANALAVAAMAVLEACTREFGWDPSADDGDPVSRGSSICWGDLRDLSKALGETT